MTNWWKCKILSDNKVTLPFIKGDLVYAKGEAEWIILFDGRREIKIHKLGMKHIRFLSRLDQKETGRVEWDYQLKKAGQLTNPA